VAFQIVDDILGVTANEKELGKPVGSDIREGKRTLLVIHTLTKGSIQEKKSLLKALGNKKATVREFSTATRAMISSGAMEYSKRKAAEYTDKARVALLSLPESDSRTLLDSALTFIGERTY
jgi:geranylgeranyl diphosphate synthase type I